MPPTAGILFDKDGTLLDYTRTWASLTAQTVRELAEGDEALATLLADAAGFDLAKHCFRPHSAIVSGSALDIVAAWAPLLPGHDAASLIESLNTGAAQVGDHLTPAAEDLDALLGTLIGAGYILGVATHDSEDAAQKQLAHLGVFERFEFVAGYDSGYAPKPDRAMLDGFCAATGIDAAEVIVVGDSLHDLGMGRNGGARVSVGVLTGAATADDLTALADVILDDIDALPGWLGL